MTYCYHHKVLEELLEVIVIFRLKMFGNETNPWSHGGVGFVKSYKNVYEWRQKVNNRKERIFSRYIVGTLHAVSKYRNLIIQLQLLATESLMWVLICFFLLGENYCTIIFYGSSL